MFVKKQALHSRHHTHYADFHAAIETCLGELYTTHKTALHSLITLNSRTLEQCAIDSRVRDSTNSGGRTHAVSELKTNPFGLYDIHGNVWEWVQDVWEPTYYGQFQEKPAINPSGPSSSGTGRVVRGGGWQFDALRCRTSNRFANGSLFSCDSVGFRVSLTVYAVRQALKVTGPAMPKAVATRPSAPVSE